MFKKTSTVRHGAMSIAAWAVICVIAVWAIGVVPARATLVTIQAASNALGFVEDTNGDGAPDRQQTSSILVRRFPGVGLFGIDQRGVAEFDLGGILGTPQMVTSAKLVLTAFNTTIAPLTPSGISITPGFNLQLFGYAGDGLINFGTDWSGGGTFLSSQVLSGATTTVTFDAMNLVVPLLNANTRFAGVNLRTDFSQIGVPSPLAQFRLFPADVSPRLEINLEPIPIPVPEPSGVLLLVLGLLGLAASTRGQRV